MIKNIVFDMGGVLMHYDADMFARGFTDNDEDAGRLAREVFRSVEWVMLDRGSLTFDRACERMRSRLPERLHGFILPLIEQWHGHMRPIEGMRELVEDITDNGCSVYLLSNTAVSYYDYRHNIPAHERFCGEFISADHKLLKPDPRIYRAFLSVYGLEAQSCFFVDDLPINVEGAIDVGFHGMVFRGDVNELRLALTDAGVNFNE